MKIASHRTPAPLFLMAAALAAAAAYAGTFEIFTLADNPGTMIQLRVLAGKAWRNTFTYQGRQVTSPPQIAVWTEGLNGKFLETLYVSRKFATQAWSGEQEQRQDATFRAESLPYWMHRQMTADLPPPTRKAPLPDAVTGATPEDGFLLTSTVPLEPAEVYVFMEVNAAFDNNPSYPADAPPGSENYSGASGQPAVVFRARVSLDRPGEAGMSLIGHSSPSGEGGNLIQDTSNLTTAMDIVREATVLVR